MIKLKDLLKENPKDFVDKNIDSKELLYRKKKYYIEAAKIKKAFIVMAIIILILVIGVIVVGYFVL